MLAVLEKLRITRQKRDDAKALEFDQLAKRLATDANTSEAAIDATLEASGRTIEELESAVENWRKRFATVPLLKEETELREELQHTHDALPLLEAELKALTERVNHARQEAANRQTQIRNRLRQIGEAKRGVESACKDHDALNRLRRAREALQAIESPLQSCRSSLNSLNASVPMVRRELEELDARRDSLSGVPLHMANERRAYLERQLRGHENEVRRFDEEIAKLASQQADAQREVADAEAAVFGS